MSIFLAQIIGFYLFIVGLAMLVHQQRFRKVINEFLGHDSLVTFSGGISVLLGLLIVLNHNEWIPEWPVVVTIIGWIVLLQGILRLFFPGAFAQLIKDLLAKSGYLVVSWVELLVGLYLIWAGFSHY